MKVTITEGPTSLSAEIDNDDLNALQFVQTLIRPLLIAVYDEESVEEALPLDSRHIIIN